MLIQRQLPLLYARGSIFNVTAKDLSEDDRARAEEIIELVKQDLQVDRQQFIFKLSGTIGADYRDTSFNGPADTEFQFAVWKGTLHLLYHCDYTFVCRHCGNGHYLNNSGRVAKIDQRKIFCPACQHCEISDPKKSKLKKGQFINKDDLLQLIDDLAEKGLEPPKYRSCIKSAKGEKKNLDPQSILEDPEQRKRWFSEFVWNYFKQMIKENKIQKQFATRLVDGFSDIVTVNSIIGYLQKNNIRFSYLEADNPKYGYHFIECELLGLAPRYIPEFAEVMHRAREWGVMVDLLPTGVRVYDQGADAIMVTHEIKTREYVIVETSVGQKDGDKYPDKIESLEDPMEEISEFERIEAVETLRGCLSDQARRMADILSQVGEDYLEFEKQFGPSKPTKRDIAKYLGISEKAVKDLQNEIKTHWVRLIPAE